MDGAIGEHGSVAPDFTVPIIGFRRWRVENGLLHSPHVSSCIWVEPEREAHCLTFSGDPKQGHPSPDEDCHCGLYGYTDIVDHGRWGWQVQPGNVAGAVIASGRIVVHEHGWRAQKVRIIALAEPDPDDVLTASPADVKQVAKALGVPCVSPDDLEVLASEYGEPVPESVLERVREKNRERERARIEHRQRSLMQQQRLGYQQYKRQVFGPSFFSSITRYWRGD